MAYTVCRNLSSMVNHWQRGARDVKDRAREQRMRMRARESKIVREDVFRTSNRPSRTTHEDKLLVVREEPIGQATAGEVNGNSLEIYIIQDGSARFKATCIPSRYVAENIRPLCRPVQAVLSTSVQAEM
jgi:hypothetical protein